LSLVSVGHVIGGIVKTAPEHSGHIVVLVKGEQLLVWADEYQGSVTTSASTSHPQAVVEGGGGGGMETISFGSGSEGNVINVTLNISSHEDENGVECLPSGDTFDYNVTVPKVEFAELVRDEEEPDLPSSVPPTKDRDVEVTITPSPLPSGHFVKIDVDDGGNSTAGSASILAPSNGQLYESGFVTVTGNSQTEEGNAGGLKLRSVLDADPNKEINISFYGFAVCAHPHTVQITYL
jgi:hypothetical protein